VSDGSGCGRNGRARGWRCTEGVVGGRLAAATLSGRGARVYTCTCVHDNIPYRRLPKYADRRIPTHHKPSAGMPGRRWLGVVTP